MKTLSEYFILNLWQSTVKLVWFSVVGTSRFASILTSGFSFDLRWLSVGKNRWLSLRLADSFGFRPLLYNLIKPYVRFPNFYFFFIYVYCYSKTVCRVRIIILIKMFNNRFVFSSRVLHRLFSRTWIYSFSNV